MAVADSGSWKLLIIPLIVIFAIGIVLNMVISPFVDAGMQPDTNNLTLITDLNSVINVCENQTFVVENCSSQTISGTEFIFLWITGRTLTCNNATDVVTLTSSCKILGLEAPASAMSGVANQIELFTYLPSWLAIPLIIILIMCFAYVTYIIFVLLIP